MKNCEKCGQAWIVHNDDGSCINDEVLEAENTVMSDEKLVMYYAHQKPDQVSRVKPVAQAQAEITWQKAREYFRKQ